MRTLRFSLVLFLVGLASPAPAMETIRGALGASPSPSPSPAEVVQAAASATATPAPSPAQAPRAESTATSVQPPVVRVNVTSQSPNFAQPWRRSAPTIRQGLGVVLADGRILVTAELVANHTYVELEKPETALKAPAEVEVVDYDANLALLAAPGAEFLQSIPGAKLDESLQVGDKVEILQLEPNGKPLRTSATLTTAEVGPYPVDENAFLVFKLSLPLQTRENSFTVPAFRDGKLVGMLMRYDPRSQTADTVPAPVIEQFLKAAARKPYDGFPRAGVTFSDTRDPQLRRYVKLPNGNGAYVTKVLPGSPAAEAGIRQGDVILSVDGKSVDQDGNYEDPRFGKISLAHYISTTLQSGQKVPLTIWRDGAEKELELTVAPRDRARMISQPYIFDEQPRYVIVGGIVFTELSRQYLREWGPNWTREAPLKLVYMDRFQNELPPETGKVVFISAVLPGPNTMGYDELGFEVVKSVNGREIHSLEDLAAAVDAPEGSCHKIKLAEDPGLVVLDVEGSKSEEARIKQEYGLNSLRRLGNEQP